MLQVHGEIEFTKGEWLLVDRRLAELAGIGCSCRTADHAGADHRGTGQVPDGDQRG
ncbi:hypothetical protein AB0395_09960 [Streptosporangium sp. NPDC051023]|uniref:hypothetical protein n=1 Tax=Streptosporangium sp. NPDC051023 TaxID=3155410 RepID=UPI00344B4DE6